MFTRFIVSAIVLMLAATTGISPIKAQPTENQSGDDASRPPLIIDSQRTEYDLRAGVTRFSEDVRIERGDMHVDADQGIIYQDEGRISVIELSGDPTTWRDRLEDGSVVEGQASNIHFDVAENIVTLTGNARIQHEQGAFTGDELIYDLDSESLTGRSQGEGRVRVVIEPGSMDRDQQTEEEQEAGGDNGTHASSTPQSEPSDGADAGNATENNGAPESPDAASGPDRTDNDDADDDDADDVDSAVPDPPAQAGRR